MAMTEYASGTAALTTNGADVLLTPTATETTNGVLQVFLDLSDLDADSEIMISVAEKATSSSSQVVVFTASLAGPIGSTNAAFVSPSLMLMHGWSVTLTKIAGAASVNVPYSLRFI